MVSSDSVTNPIEAYGFCSSSFKTFTFYDEGFDNQGPYSDEGDIGDRARNQIISNNSNVLYI